MNRLFKVDNWSYSFLYIYIIQKTSLHGKNFKQKNSADKTRHVDGEKVVNNLKGLDVTKMGIYFFMAKIKEKKISVSISMPMAKW